jgi:succinate dehydrogenase/fumarate reductase flavoprotein subunit
MDLRGVEEASIPGDDLLKARLKKVFAYDTRPVGITPACHHTMGGLVIDSGGRTGIRNLFAAGEVGGGIHGANRMGGNALSEALVFGALAGRSAVEGLEPGFANPDFEGTARLLVEKRFQSRLSKGASPSSASYLMERLGKVLWEKVGIVRNAQSLTEALREIDEILGEGEDQRTDIPREFARILELRNSALTGRAIAASALERTESRGSHYREDFPLEDEHWIKNIHVGLVEGLPEVTRILPLAG